MKNKVCGIYKITNNLNGMSYVGQSVNCMNRWDYHKSPSSNYTPIDKTINEFGKEHFTFSILLECSPDMLDVWERDMINLHDTIYPNGYNMQGGGRDGFNICEETRMKISESCKGSKGYWDGKNRPEETIRKISESLKGQTPWNKDKVTPESVRRKISESCKGKPNPKYKWLTPQGEVREMSANCVSHWHPDWVLIEKDL